MTGTDAADAADAAGASRSGATLADHPKRYCPACERLVRRDFRKGPGGRPDAACPRCGSLERHRFLPVLLGLLRPGLGDIDVLLEVAPSAQTTPMLAGLGARRHLRIDLGADSRLVDVLGDLTRMPLPDASIDLMVCYHVLEHVPDDRAAMAEIARVLSAGGTALVQVPWRPGTPTDEDPGAPEPERIARFGQADHVRYYGDDFEDRLQAAGLSVCRLTPRSVLGDQMCTWLRLQPDEAVWILRRAGDAPGHLAVPEPFRLPAVLGAVLDQLVEERDKQQRLRSRVRRLRARQAGSPPPREDRAPAATPPPRLVRVARRLLGRSG